MAGLKRIAKLFGGITVNGKKYVWDYAIDKAVPAEEMPLGSERHALSEKMREEVVATSCSQNPTSSPEVNEV